MGLFHIGRAMLVICSIENTYFSMFDSMLLFVQHQSMSNFLEYVRNIVCGIFKNTCPICLASCCCRLQFLHTVPLPTNSANLVSNFVIKQIEIYKEFFKALLHKHNNKCKCNKYKFTLGKV